MISHEIERNLSNSAFVVEANSFEQNVLWQHYSSESTNTIKGITPVKWEDISSGYGIHIGELDNMPVMLSLRRTWINGVLITFYYGMSKVVDYRMVDQWLKQNYFDKYNKTNLEHSCDASSFSSCIYYIEKINKNL